MSLYPSTGNHAGPLFPVSSSVIERPVSFRVLRKKDLAKKLGCSPSTIDNRRNPASPWYDPTFPRPIELGAGGSRSSAKGWLEHVVDAWLLAGLEQGRRSSQPH